MKLSLTSICILLTLITLPTSSHAQRLEPQRISVSDDVALHYVELGKGEPIIFVHGLTGDYTVWLGQLKAFADADYRAIAYSRRYNFPNENELEPNHSAVVEAEDLAALINALELDNAHIVGHSYGAYTALMLALNHPELVRTVTLAEPPIVPWLPHLPGQQSEGKARLNRLMSEGIAPAKAAFESGNEEAAIRAMFDCIAEKEIYDTLPRFVKNRCRRNAQEMRAIVFSDNRYPDVSRAKVRKMTVPTLILSGSKSRATARWTDPELERLLPKTIGNRVVLPGATHIMWVEQPTKSRNAVLTFVRGK